jgi:hypothetical protein
VNKGRVISEVVDTDNIDIWVGECGAEEVAANTSKSVDSDINHFSILIYLKLHLNWALQRPANEEN